PTKTGQFLEGFQPNLLHDVLDFAFPSRITAGCGKQSRGILLNQRLKACNVALEDGGYQVRIGLVHFFGVCAFQTGKVKNREWLWAGLTTQRKLTGSYRNWYRNRLL